MRTLILGLAALCAGCGLGLDGNDLSAQASAGSAERREAGEARLTVMSRNLYLGAEITGLVAATGPVEAVEEANQIWATVQATRFPERAEAIAREVDQAGPDVLALQEVTLWRLGYRAACKAEGPVPPTAQDVAYDFLAILLEALERRGLHYDVAAQVTSMDAELCIGDLAHPKSMRDLRYTDRDVILVRHGVQWRDPTLPPAQPLPGFEPAPVPFGPGDRNGALYAVSLGTEIPATAFFTIGGGGEPVFSWRGWTAVEVERGGRWIRVFETHVEDTLPMPPESGLQPWFFQALQDAQLVAIVDAVYLDPETTLPTVVLGDFNAYVQPDDPAPPTYAFLTGGPFPLDPALDGISPLRDAWTRLHPCDWGFTWGFDEDLRGGVLSTRLDLVLSTPELTPRSIARTGVHERVRGLHPSDHAGLVATLAIP